jgi:hypothetical protein
VTLPNQDNRRDYRNSRGEPIPGVTTVLKQLGWSKDALIGWAHRLGRQGRKLSERDEAAAIGQQAHEFIAANLSGRTPDTDPDLTPEEMRRAFQSAAAALLWLAEHRCRVLLSEQAIVSECERFGGTMDVVASLDERLVVLDLKTGGLYDESIVQMAAYAHLLEGRHDVVEAVLLSCRPDETPRAITVDRPTLQRAYRDVFLPCLQLHEARGAVRVSSCRIYGAS